MNDQQLAAIEARAAAAQHEILANWMKWLFSICHEVRNGPGVTGSVVIPPELVRRWQRQIVTPYDKLSAKEQESDKREADKALEAAGVPALVAEVERLRAKLVKMENLVPDLIMWDD